MGKKPASHEELAAMVERGDILQERGDSAGALREYEQALREAPDEPMIWNNRGVALSSLGRYEEAIGSYRKATELRPGYWMAWYNLGKALHRRATGMGRRPGRPGEAGGRPDERIPPEQAKALEEAIETYDRALLLNPAHTSTLNNKAVALRELHLFEEALAVYDELLGVDPLYAHAWHNKGKLLDVMGLPREADRCYEVAVSLNPDFARGRGKRGKAGAGPSGGKRSGAGAAPSDDRRAKAGAVPSDDRRAGANEGSGGADAPGNEQTDLRDVEPPGRPKRKTGQPPPDP